MQKHSLDVLIAQINFCAEKV